MATLGVFTDEFYNASAKMSSGLYVATTQNGGTLTAVQLCGAQENYLALSGQTGAQALTTDTAVNIIARLLGMGVPNIVGLSFFTQLVNNNTSSGAITLTGGTGVTITGTNTIAITTSRQYLVTVTGPTTITFQNVGSGTV